MRVAITISCLLGMIISSCGPAGQESITEITPRNRAINQSNAYNNLFLDSSVMEQFIARQKLDDTLANRIRSFYNARNYQYAWFDKSGLTEQAYSFRSVYDYTKDSTDSKALEYRLDDLMKKDDSINTAGPMTARTELQLTRRFIRYFLHTFKDEDVSQLEQYIPSMKQEILVMADSILSLKARGSRKFEGAKALEAHLEKYAGLARNGGWQPVPADRKQYRKGDHSPVIVLIRKRLQATGELPEQDTAAVFDEALEKAVKAFQLTHGYTPNGVVNDTLIREMNVPAKARLQQLLMNMDRMRWMPPQPEGRRIVVNIPEFMLHVWEGDKKAFDMPVVVGREGSSTVMFSGNLNQVVFSPNWNIPASIVRKEVLPAMQRNSNYLQEKNMEITGERNGLPVIRQLPGRENPLGKIKFLFPNSFNIYFHDTPARELFSKDKRAYSHGCIRLGDAPKMAAYLLQGTRWTPERIDSAMNRGKEKYVRIEDPVPVLITYYTAWVDEHQLLHFREDIYGHDSALAVKMFTDAVVLKAQ